MKCPQRKDKDLFNFVALVKEEARKHLIVVCEKGSARVFFWFMFASQPLFPPNGGGNKVEMSSFKEKLLGKPMVSSKRSRGNLFELNLARAELENGNHLLLKIFWITPYAKNYVHHGKML